MCMFTCAHVPMCPCAHVHVYTDMRPRVRAPPQVSNGSPLTNYRVVCTDVSTYIASASSAWRQATRTIFHTPTTQTGTDSITVDQLYPGTTYACSLSAKNGIGGYDAPLVPVGQALLQKLLKRSQ